jgi:hypothetical protein
MSVSRNGRRALSIALTTALAGATVFTLQGTSSAAPSASGTAAPAAGKLTSGTVTAITGTGFKDAAGVTAVHVGGGLTGKLVLGTAACADATASGGTVSFSVVSATRITATMPAHAAGAMKACFPIWPHTATAWVSVPYSYAAQPVLGAVDKSAGPVYGGQTVTVTASPIWRANSTAVTVGGVAASNVKVATDGTSLTFTTPAGTGSGLAIVVKTPGFADVTAAAAYAYQNAIKVSPSMIDPAGGDTLDVVGSGFTGFTAAGVWLQDGTVDAACTNVQVVSDTEISCDVAAHSAAAVTVVVGEDVDGTLANATGTTVVTSGSTVTYATY